MLPFSYSYREMEVYKSLSFVCKIYRIYYLLTLYVRLTVREVALRMKGNI